VPTPAARVSHRWAELVLGQPARLRGAVGSPTQPPVHHRDTLRRGEPLHISAGSNPSGRQAASPISPSGPPTSWLAAVPASLAGSSRQRPWRAPRPIPRQPVAEVTPAGGGGSAAERLAALAEPPAATGGLPVVRRVLGPSAPPDPGGEGVIVRCAFRTAPHVLAKNRWRRWPCWSRPIRVAAAVRAVLRGPPGRSGGHRPKPQ
jgi:hypothetical protein